MPRLTREQTDAEIVDRASALFARHGVAHTSLQRIADEVGYSKAGLLHHFPSKEAIADAAVRAVTVMTADLVALVDGTPAGAVRDRLLVEALVDNAFDRAGVAAFLGAAAADPTSAHPQLMQAAIELAELFGLSDEGTAETRMVQVLIASAGLQLTTQVAVQTGQTRTWRPRIIEAAMVALGHPNRYGVSDK